MDEDVSDDDTGAISTAEDLVARVAAISPLGVEGPDATAAADALASVASDTSRLLDAGPSVDANP